MKNNNSLKVSFTNDFNSQIDRLNQQLNQDYNVENVKLRFGEPK